MTSHHYHSHVRPSSILIGQYKQVLCYDITSLSQSCET